jgi:hypothetical protein
VLEVSSLILVKWFEGICHAASMPRGEQRRGVRGESPGLGAFRCGGAGVSPDI